MKRKKQKTSHESRLEERRASQKIPFIEHLYELRKRLFYIALSVIGWGAATYFVQQHVVAALLRPARNQQFIYTSVGGGIDFLFRVCIYMGIALSIPVIVYQSLKYVEPLIKKDAVKFIGIGSVASGVLALAGMSFGYFIGLPAALHFLLHQFSTNQIHPLLTIQSYMGFVTMYLLGSALLFQLPLILILINRIKPLKPQKLFHYERWVILLAFIGGGLLNPSPRIQDQLLLSGPVILAYQLAILIIWMVNRSKNRPQSLANLVEQDAEARQERLAHFREAQAALHNKQLRPAVQAAAIPQPQVHHAPVARPVVTAKLAPIRVAAPAITAPTAPAPAPVAAPQQLRPSVTSVTAPLPPRPTTDARGGRRSFNDFVGPRRMYGPLNQDAGANT
ncbi:MAG TPA: twin-arginine translocase subunit TatC [Patescibacteria group bacterium]|nr:twin-arginine translocase subunit TatC [Patescibacteria group bacterium]